MRCNHFLVLLSSLALTLTTPGLAQSASTPQPTSVKPAAATTQASRTTVEDSSTIEQQARDLQKVLDDADGEPGARLHGLEAFLKRYPHPAAAAQIYQLMIKDATALNDDSRVLLYNEKLQETDPGDLAQRIRTLNLLLLYPDAEHLALAQTYANELSRAVEAKSKEAAPDQLGAARWQIDLNRMRALAELFQGSVAQLQHRYADAEQSLQASLNHAQTEEAAQHLARTCVAENKMPQALQAYALALALPGTTIAQRAVLRKEAGDLYRKLHNGSETGFGDMILHRFDEVAERDAVQEKQINPNRHNGKAQTPGGFLLSSLDGQTHQLDQYKGKVIVIDFWATWCGPCKIQHPLLEELKKKYAGNPNVIFIAINEDEDQSRVEPFLTANQWDKTTWLDAGLGTFLGIDSLPTTMILGREGQILFREAGFEPDAFEQQIDAAIQKALQNHPS